MKRRVTIECKDANGMWRETYTEPESELDTETVVKDWAANLVKKWNDTLRPTEHPREFLGVVDDRIVEDADDEDEDEDEDEDDDVDDKDDEGWVN